MRVLDLESADLRVLVQDTFQVQLDTGSATKPTKIILPKRRCRITVGPIHTTGTEGTYLSGAIRFGRDDDPGGTLEAFESWGEIASGGTEQPAVQRRYYLPNDGTAITWVMKGGSNDAQWMMVTASATDGVLQLGFDAVDG